MDGISLSPPPPTSLPAGAHVTSRLTFLPNMYTVLYTVKKVSDFSAPSGMSPARPLAGDGKIANLFYCVEEFTKIF